MSIDLKFLGSKLRKCRDQLQLDTKEVSGKTGIPIERVQELEEGKKEPSGDEILIFADFYKQDYRFFISNQQQTASDQIDILYRKFGNEFSKEDRWAIQEFMYLCECEQSIWDEIKFQTKDFNFTPKGEYYKKHAEEASQKLRKDLGYTPNNIISDIYADFRKIGIHIFRRRLKNSSFSGLFINHPYAGKCVLVNYDEDIYRQNFTVAHEVAHAIFDYKEDVSISFTYWDKKDLKEIRANTFASHYLVPPEALKTLKATTWKPEFIIQIANKLKVNIETLLIVLKNINSITDDQYQELKGIKIPKDQKEDPELTGLSERRKEAKLYLLEKGLSSFYVRQCYDAYSQGIISAKRLAEMFLTNDVELPIILDLFNLKLIYDN